ncbi:MAG: cardiolipin synthase, partial [Paramuribaculum sp.]|nr:cardiolipin synthase [Paramuribaculum sp.]
FNVWRDTHIRITGPAVGALQFSFAVDWRFMGRELIQETVTPSTGTPEGNAAMHLLSCGPTSEWSNIAYLLLKAIGNAKKRILIQTPYFLPTESLLKALQVAALSRVDVRVMLPRKSDSHILDYASRSYIFECLRAGVKIYFFDAGMLHSKSVVIDDDFSSIGSANMDFRSFEHNFEANMFIYSREVNKKMQSLFAEDMRSSKGIKISDWRKRPRKQKILESILRLLSPIL